jgi:hypothetical protein
METYLPYWITRICMQTSFQNTGYFSGVPVFDQNGARSQAYLPAAFEPTKDK